MNHPYDPLDLIEYARARWRTAAAIVGGALAAALALSLLLPNQYTATASIVIEPPGGSDPRISTAVSPVYLESLKTYEQFASSDSLFAEACARFGLLNGAGAPALETLKRRVLEVRKPKETKLLKIAVTLRDPKAAHLLAEYLARRTVDLSNRVAGEGEATSLDKARARLETVRSEVARIEQELTDSASAGRQTSLDAELVALSQLQGELASDIVGTGARIAELSAQDGVGPQGEYARNELKGQRARLASLEASRANLARDIAAKGAALSAIQARHDRLQDGLRAAQSDVEMASKQLSEVESTAGMRAEQLRIIDPGIVPQRPSSPDLPLNCASALALGTVAAAVYLAMQFGLERQRARLARTSIKVAQRDSA